MSDDGFAELAAQSAKVRNEHRLLLEGLKSFEQKLVELVDGLGCGGNSKTICFDEVTDAEGEPLWSTEGYLGFYGTELFVGVADLPPPSGENPYWRIYTLDTLSTSWQRYVSDPEVLNSLLVDLRENLEREFEITAPVVKSLAQFVTAEKAQIDADLDEFFNRSPALFDSWLKARKSVITDPELCITLSCSHVETVLKQCLKKLGATDYEKLAIEKLYGMAMRLFRNSSAIDTATMQMLQGVGTTLLGVGTIRNAQSVSHGKTDDYVRPTSDLAQTVNHLAGVVSVFTMKQTDLLTKGR
ncbi:abortive infection family protein [Pseudomonas sp. MWU12-2345]|uniref:abortive infection family protein n=1 Tax=Pseudomonas sp. MWU12-2345 TaxID=2928689 RepID=UPI002010A77E|nr:abortive infection family protein [Pseudomonas sp. MWU12-2345]